MLLKHHFKESVSKETDLSVLAEKGETNKCHTSAPLEPSQNNGERLEKKV